jgi:hypothetical protein
MKLRREILAAAAVGISAAFAAQPTSERAGVRQGEEAPQRESWAPGANALMSAHDSTTLLLTPPR